MFDSSLRLLRTAIAAAAAAIVATACDSGPSDSEFIAACLAEGERGIANKAMRREMGVKGEEFCQCGAKQARTVFSPELRRVMVLGMQGKKAEANAVVEKLNDKDQEAFMKGAMTIFGTCAGKMR
jgi:hypothetical protein